MGHKKSSMKRLFRQKQWVIVQAIFVIIGIAFTTIVKAEIPSPVGGIGIGLHFVADTHEYAIPICLILDSDLVLNIEYIQGTFMTSLMSGWDRRFWMLRKSAAFYLFVLLQCVIAFLIFWLFAGIVTEHFGLEGIQMSGTSLAGTKVGKFPGLIVFSIVRTLAFVSFGVFVSTLMPGKLTIGSIIAMGTVLTVPSFVDAVFDNYKRRKIFNFINATICLAVPAKSWIYATLWLVLFTWFSMERVKRMELVNRGA